MLTLNRFSFAILLIGFGTLLLLNQLGYFSLEWSEILKTYWPAIFVVSGLDMSLRGIVRLFQKRGSVSMLLWGLFWIVAGLAWIGVNLGMVNFGWGDFFVALLAVGLIILGINVMFNKPKVVVHIEKNQDVEDDSEDDDDHFDIEPPPVPGEDPELHQHFKHMEKHKRHVEQQMRQAEKKLRDAEREARRAGKDIRYTFKGLKISPDTDTKRGGLLGDIKMGGEHWSVQDMEISHGLGSIDIDFGKASFPEKEVTVVITSWAGEIDLALPQDLPVTVIASVSAGELHILDNKLDGMKREFIYVSEGYEEAVSKLKLIIRLGAGEVKVTRHV